MPLALCSRIIRWNPIAEEKIEFLPGQRARQDLIAGYLSSLNSPYSIQYLGKWALESEVRFLRQVRAESHAVLCRVSSDEADYRPPAVQ